MAGQASWCWHSEQGAGEPYNRRRKNESKIIILLFLRVPANNKFYYNLLLAGKGSGR